MARTVIKKKIIICKRVGEEISYKPMSGATITDTVKKELKPLMATADYLIARLGNLKAKEIPQEEETDEGGEIIEKTPIYEQAKDGWFTQDQVEFSVAADKPFVKMRERSDEDEKTEKFLRDEFTHKDV